MMGVVQPLARMPSTMYGTASAAASLLTVIRTSSEPARASAAICWTVDSTSAVSVLVIDCTTTGAEDPMRTPPTLTVTAFLGWIGGIRLKRFYHFGPFPTGSRLDGTHEAKDETVAAVGGNCR